MADLRYSIELLHPPELALSRTQLGSGRAVIGRGTHCEVPIEARGVSREHVAIEVLPDGGATLTDLGSTNGSRVDGRAIGSCALRGDFVLELGEVRLRFHEHDPELGMLAFRPELAAPPSASHPQSGVDADPPTRTRLNIPLQRLQEAVSGCLDVHAGLATASATLAACLTPLEARAASLRDGHGRLLAAAGSEECEEQAWIRTEHFTVFLDAAAKPDEAVTASVGQWLGWLGTGPQSATGAPIRQPPFPGVVGAGTVLQARLRGLARVARSRIGVLILGESGTGKELVARWVHDCSPRASGPFVAINCAALPRDLLEAELFGIEKGAATGVDARPGVFERAHGGTLFLDELGDMPAETQVRLLRAVEDGRIHRVGGKQLLDVDVRLVSATHADMQQAIEAQTFRLDLYHRIAGFEIDLPALRARPGDIAPLAFRFYGHALRENSTHSPGMTEAALRCLRAWHWPGNVRELRQAIEGAVALLVDGEALDASHLPARMRAGGAFAERAMRSSDPVDDDDESMAAAVARAERAAILRALETHADVPEAAWLQLGIGKTTFYKKLKEHGIQRDGASGAESPDGPAR